MTESQQEKKRQTRIAVNIPAQYNFKGNQGDCTVTDFSEGGIGIEANQIFVEGDTINVKFSPVPNLDFDIWCVARNVQGRKVGLEFEEISNQQMRNLENYVYDLLNASNKSRYEPVDS